MKFPSFYSPCCLPATLPCSTARHSAPSCPPCRPSALYSAAVADPPRAMNKARRGAAGSAGPRRIQGSVTQGCEGGAAWGEEAGDVALPGVYGHFLEISCEGQGSGERATSCVSSFKKKWSLSVRFPVTMCVSLAPRAAREAAESALFWTPSYNPIHLGAESPGPGEGAHVLVHARPQVQGIP